MPPKLLESESDLGLKKLTLIKLKWLELLPPTL